MPWTQAHIDRITAALGLPVDASGEDVAVAVRLCTKRCEELERMVVRYQETQQEISNVEIRLQRLEAGWRPSDNKP